MPSLARRANFIFFEPIMANPVKSMTSLFDRVEQFLDQQNVRKAADTLETLKFTPDASGERLVALLQRTASVAIDCNVVTVVVRMAKVLSACAISPVVVATLLAQAGDLKQALASLKDAHTPQIETMLVGHVIDWNVAKRGITTVPAEHRPATDLFLKALKAYDAKDNTGARDALQTIGASSPLIEWKLFLRGLLAWTENDDQRANENFRRLNPDRLPARLSTALLNPVQLTKVIPAAGAIGKLIRDWRTAIAKRQSFTPLFKHFKKLILNLSEQEKALLPRLAKCYYAEIESRGSPDDMKAYRDLFGPPPLDPNFDRLEAVVLDRVGQFALAQDHWHKYEAWVAKATPWPKPINDLVRAIIRNNEGELARSIQEEPVLDMFEMMFRTLNAKRLSLPDVAPKVELTKADAIRFWLESHRLAPDWNEPLLNLLAVAETEPLREQICPLCEEFLIRVPEDMKLREDLAAHYYDAAQYADAARHLNEALTRNPLDADLGVRFETVSMLLLFSKLGQQPVTSILEELKSLRAQKRRSETPFFDLMQSTLETRENGQSEAVLPGKLMVCETYLRVVLSVLYKDKPAVKTKTKKAYTEAIENEKDPAALMATIHFHQLLKLAAVKFTGQGVIEKQLFTLLSQQLLTETRINVIEAVLEAMRSENVAGPLVKSLFTAMADKYPKNPIVQYVEMAYRLEHNKKRLTHQEAMRFDRIRKICEASTEPKYQAILAKIEALMQRYDIRDLDDYY